jgi:hypothetical protein
VQLNCQPFRGLAGERFLTFEKTISAHGVNTWIVDRTGALVCDRFESGQDGCVLPETGTYRLVSHLSIWDEEVPDATYELWIRRLTRPAGCSVVRPGAYNAPPAGAPDRSHCRILDIPAAGAYRVQTVYPDNYATMVSVYDVAGSRVCFGGVCTFAAAGRYTMVRDPDVMDDHESAQILVPVIPSGCAPVPDAGYEGPPSRGEFRTFGQMDCLRLSSPAGARVIQLMPADAVGAGLPSVSIYDADGDYICDQYLLWHNSCELDGTAPFHAVFAQNEGAPLGPYATAFARVDGPPDCPVAPRGTDGVTTTTGPDRFAACFSIPADQRGAEETFTFRRTSGTGAARLSVFSADDGYSCTTNPSADHTFTCALPEGPATVILRADAVDATYQLTHAAAAP